MTISGKVEIPKAFCKKLSSEQLEILCNIDFDKLKPKKGLKDPEESILSDEDYLLAIEWQFYALVELTSRLEYGFHHTATDKWEALKYRNKAKALRAEALFMELEALKKRNKTAYFEWNKIDDNAWYQVHHTAIDDIRDPSNPIKNTSLLKAALPFKSPSRLTIGRANRVYGNIFKTEAGTASSFLPAWYSVLGVENSFEIATNGITVIRTLAKGKREVKNINFVRTPEHETEINELNEKASNVGFWERFNAVMFKGNRPSQFANGFLWLTANGLGLKLTAMVAAAAVGTVATIVFPPLGISIAATLLASYITLSGTVGDIIIDLFGSIYELFNLSSLHRKIAAKDPDKDNFLNKNILRYVSNELQIKTQDSLVTRHFRLACFNVFMFVTMWFILFPPTAPFAVAILGVCALFSLLADVIPSLKLANNFNNRVDKVRALVSFALLLLAVGLGVAMIFGAPFITIPMIGAGLALLIGTTSLARRIARIDFGWVKNKFGQFASAVADFFGRHLGLKFGLDLTTVEFPELTTTAKLAAVTSSTIESSLSESAELPSKAIPLEDTEDSEDTSTLSSDPSEISLKTITKPVATLEEPELGPPTMSSPETSPIMAIKSELSSLSTAKTKSDLTASAGLKDSSAVPPLFRVGSKDDFELEKSRKSSSEDLLVTTPPKLTRTRSRSFCRHEEVVIDKAKWSSTIFTLKPIPSDSSSESMSSSPKKTHGFRFEAV